MLDKGWWESLELEPFCVGRPEREEISGLAWVVGAVHVGVEKNTEMCRKLELIKCENVVAADGGGVWILQESTEMATCTGEVCRVWRGREGFFPCAVVV